MGVSDSETMGDLWLEKLHPEDRARTIASWRDSIDSGKPYEIEFRVRAHDGTYGWFLNRASPLRDKTTGRIYRWLGVSTDITARKNTEEELKRTARILNSIMATSSDLIYVKDRSLRMVYCNPTTLKVLQATEADIYGKKDSDFIGLENGAAEIMEVDRRIMDNGMGETAEEWVTWPDGTKRLYLSRKEPQLDASGKVIGLIGISRDITERKAAQDEISKTVQDLIQERDIREKFVATLSHDLRTPLTSAKMSANLLAKKANDPEALQRLSGRIADAIDRADQMIRDLLDANLIRVGEKLPIEITACDLVEVVSSTLDELSSVHGDRFVLNAPQEIDGFWSESGVRRIVENLCSNAIKYGDASPVKISLARKDESVIISIHNRGPAITLEEQATLFDPYTRTALAKTGKQKGWGLGLTLVKGLAESHEGSVNVVSSKETGTTFSVVLPLDARKAK
jgi:PAS domain S-box-containing protein